MEVSVKEFHMIQDKDGATYIINCGQPSMGLIEISPEEFYMEHNHLTCRKYSFIEYIESLPVYSESAKRGFKVVKFGLATVYQGGVEDDF